MAEPEVADLGGRAKTDDDVLLEARRRFRLVADGEAELRALMLEDKQFRAGNQWHEKIKQQRERDARPVLTIDKLRQPVRQIINQQRTSKLAIDIHPKGGAATDDAAEMLQGLIRHIEVQSVAEVAYSWAFEDAATVGRGFWRVLTEYSNDDDDDQDIVIKRVINPFTVYPDLACVEPDYSDMRYCFIVEDLDPDEFAVRFPDNEPSSAEIYRSLGDESARWLPGGKVRIAEYWRVTERKRKDGKANRTRRIVEQFVMSGAEVLERNQWAGRYIPIVPVIGEEMDVDGKRILQGIVRSAKDPQRMYNYWVTAETEMIGLAPRPPWLVAEGQTEGHEDTWQSANTANHAVLYYKPTSLSGQQVPPPSRQAVEPPIQAIVMAIAQASEDIKGTTGVFDPTLGRLSPSERSGRAIQALQAQGQVANANYLDNLARAMVYTGKILVDLIPTVYARRGRVARLLGEDEKATSVILNQPFVPTPGGPQALPPAPPGVPMPKGAKEYDLSTIGQFSVTVDVGPGYQTRRQEGVDAIEMLVKSNPAMAPLVADVFVENLEFPGHRQIAARLRKALPPALQDSEEGQPQIPPQVQQYLQQLEQQHQLMTQALQQMTQQIETDQVKAQSQAAIKQMELQSRERVEAMKVQADLIKTEATINAQQAQALITAELQRIQAAIEAMYEMQVAGAGQTHEAQLTAGQQAHEAAMAAMQAGQQRELQAGQQQHESAMAMMPSAPAGA